MYMYIVQGKCNLLLPKQSLQKFKGLIQYFKCPVRNVIAMTKHNLKH